MRRALISMGMLAIINSIESVALFNGVFDIGAYEASQLSVDELRILQDLEALVGGL